MRRRTFGIYIDLAASVAWTWAELVVPHSCPTSGPLSDKQVMLVRSAF
ncbi:predicted protein [Sclerotinia sclerotiorum 1980 UF-70]|uniref:Uncharacterized protein n=1 Tax=Sclerotinia sclerotiorum (strain ATCC 18683 / 1980 / Ss-1) TaxID=665079 RepID=A7EI29_SCLS1|nr:predicted protein [Sclerotinia sclerotiorum 1980 UF-70]EDO02495.1 predicted protein [Sclerotinia sclerotiorum 1980 UF-70]